MGLLSISLTRRVIDLETFGGYTAYQMDPDTQAITWTSDQMTQGVSYYATELNESFLRVYT